METVKEKLAELLLEFEDCPADRCAECEYEEYGDKCGAFKFAHYLIQNGVTIQEWVSVDERLPEKSEYLGIRNDGWEFYIRFEIAYKTDTIEYDIGYYDGFKWFNERNRIVKNVVGWRILETFPEPPKGDNSDE